MINRRNFTAGGALGLASASLVPSISNLAQATEIGDDGLHIQPWFLQSFMDILEDQSQLSSENKHLAILFEQKGCPYCREMHEVNLANPKTVEFINQHFGVLQVNMWGSKLVTDIDGTEMEEKEFARKWRVNFTPTIIYFRQGDLTDMPRTLAEASRMPGYLRPFHFISMFEYVADKGYEDQVFQRYIQEKVRKLEEQGIKPEIW